MIPATVVYTAHNLCLKKFLKKLTEMPETYLASCCNRTS